MFANLYKKERRLFAFFAEAGCGKVRSRIMSTMLHLHPPVSQISMLTHHDDFLSPGSFSCRNNGYEPTEADMQNVIKLCRENDWYRVFSLLQENPRIALTPIILNDRATQTTTILHQAITAPKGGDRLARELIIRKVLEIAPEAATMRNSSGILPVECLSLRGVYFESKVKNDLFSAFLKTYSMDDVSDGTGKSWKPSTFQKVQAVKGRRTAAKVTSHSHAKSLRSKGCSKHLSDYSVQRGASILLAFSSSVAHLASLDE